MKQTTENNWSAGEIAIVPRQEKLLKESSMRSYAHYIGSRYICIREAAESQRGILMKVLGKVSSKQIMTVNGEPFCVDDHRELFDGIRCFSYQFPTAAQVMEALNIVRANPDLLQKFEKASMHINPNSTFWVCDTTRSIFLLRKKQYLDGRDGQVFPDKDDTLRYRVTLMYFYNGNLYF